MMMITTTVVVMLNKSFTQKVEGISQATISNVQWSLLCSNIDRKTDLNNATAENTAIYVVLSGSKNGKITRFSSRVNKSSRQNEGKINILIMMLSAALAKSTLPPTLFTTNTHPKASEKGLPNYRSIHLHQPLEHISITIHMDFDCYRCDKRQLYASLSDSRLFVFVELCLRDCNPNFIPIEEKGGHSWSRCLHQM